ncbi:MAG: DUF2075 domain-containing protein [Afipia sp.]|nr:DUF2075 domain-containing protein [Afipia sp.]
MLPAYYSADIQKFVDENPHAISGHLAECSQNVDGLQINAWIGQIRLLQRELANLNEGWIAFEFAIPRMGKRADNIIVYDGCIFVLEFKVGSERFDRAAKDQVVDYALDLKNFHAGSHEEYVVPIVLATGANAVEGKIVWSADKVAEPIVTNGLGLAKLIQSIATSAIPRRIIDPVVWSKSGYKPTPTIIEAAQALYRGHRVDEITRSDASAINLNQTATCLATIIEDAKACGHKAICFVTGVPGAGKTLAGLNLVTQRAEAHKDENAVFLSGNGPLVDVLREALARDQHDQSKGKEGQVTKAEAARRVKGFIQNIMHFRDESLRIPAAPPERVAVFDEAQRAWDRSHLANFMSRKKGLSDFAMSEPEFLISVMDRHSGWCTVVCLIGGGQEINAGEAGLTEWFDALKTHFPQWKVFVSKQLTHRDYRWGKDLHAVLKGSEVREFDHLHLAVSVRSFRAEKLSEFVGAVVAGEIAEAKKLHNQIKNTYSIRITRDLPAARRWLREQARGTERIGLVASSGASRLKPHGINVREKIDATHWFLNGKDDVRSSFYLEDPATEFDIQGLELDWVGVCWDADLRAIDGRWSYHRFTGTKWQNVKDENRKIYLTNAYRVLLTRARQGFVIYVPPGDAGDATRPSSFYDGTAEFLMACGIEGL